MNIFKEYTENQKRVKDKIKREKDADKAKHDRMMDRARTRDTARKNAMEEIEQVDEMNPYQPSKWLQKRNKNVNKRSAKANAYLAKKDKERSDMNKKNDPGGSKHGHGDTIYKTDTEKAMKKAKERGLKPKYPKTSPHNSRVLPDGKKAKNLKRAGVNHHVVGGRSRLGEEADKSIAAKAAKSGISASTLRKVYNRGVAAWKTGHRPGTTPSQWGHARVNAFIAKKKKGGLNHDKDLA